MTSCRAMLRLVAVAGSCMLLCCGARCNAEDLPAMESLEAALRHSVDAATKKVDGSSVVFDWDVLRTMKGAEIIVARDSALWLEILEQSDYPLCRIVSFYCIRERRHDMVVYAALLHQLMADLPTMTEEIGADVVLRSAVPNQANLDAFSRATMIKRDSADFRRNLNFVMTYFTADFLEQWWRSRKVLPLSATHETLVLWHLSEKKLDGLSPQTINEVQERITALSEIPGYPRLVFVYGSTDPDRVLPKIRSLLPDETIDDFEFALAVHIHRDTLKGVDEAFLAVDGDVAAKRIKLIRKYAFRE